MEGRNLPKTNKLRKAAVISESSMYLKQYFMRYLSFQNEIVKKVKIDTNEL